MKYLIIVGDGMADYPIEALNGKTPLQVAGKPNIDALASKGRNGLLKTIPEGMEPGSDIANYSILGYDPRKYYTGRGPLEVAGRGIPLHSEDAAFRCSIVTEENSVIVDHSAGHITTEEASELVERIKERFGKPGEVDFYAGVSYRHLMVLRGKSYSDNILCTPPHGTGGVEISKIMPKAKTKEAEPTAAMLRKMIMDSREALRSHPVNAKRIREGKKPGNMIWFWGPGRKPNMPSLKEKYGVSGAVISAVDLTKGAGACAGLKIINVPGATGFHDTNYEGKADYAVKGLEEHDLIFVHVEAPDEASHQGDYELKIKCIEDLDRRLVGRVLNRLPEECVICILTDHCTPVSVKNHTSDPVPFTIYSPSTKPDGVKRFDEVSAKSGSLGVMEGKLLMPLILAAK